MCLVEDLPLEEEGDLRVVFPCAGRILRWVAGCRLCREDEQRPIDKRRLPGRFGSSLHLQGPLLRQHLDESCEVLRSLVPRKCK